MTGTGYGIFMAAFGIGLPLLISDRIPVISRWFPATINIPNRHYWPVPERRGETLLFMTWRLGWLAILIVFFVFAIHHLILMANASRPPTLAHTPFVFTLACFLAGMAVWTVLVWRRFRKPP